MLSMHVHEALARVRRVQEAVLARRFFEGYSGKARLLSGVAALAGSVVLALGGIAPDPRVHLLGWMGVLGFALLLNYGALLHWIVTEPRVRQHPAILKPALDAIPPLALGGVLTLALIRHGQYDLLFGVWMGLFGIAHAAYRQSLPGENYLVGIFYVVCGAACLIVPGVHFTSPWPMGLVFFAGETAGGISLLLMNDRQRDLDELAEDEHGEED
jgi:hypothetical protein